MKPEHRAKVDDAVAKITLALEMLYDIEMEIQNVKEQSCISGAIARLTDAGREIEKIKTRL